MRWKRSRFIDSAPSWTPKGEFDDGKWTEWSASWSEIIRVISMISDQNYTKFDYHFIRAIWNHKIQLVLIFHWSSSRFLKKWKQKRLHLILYSKQK